MTRICVCFIRTSQRLFVESSESERSSKDGTRFYGSHTIQINKDGRRGSVIKLAFPVGHAVEGGRRLILPVLGQMMSEW